MEEVGVATHSRSLITLQRSTSVEHSQHSLIRLDKVGLSNCMSIEAQPERTPMWARPNTDFGGPCAASLHEHAGCCRVTEEQEKSAELDCNSTLCTACRSIARPATSHFPA